MADVDQGLLSDILDYFKDEISEFGKLREAVGTVLAIMVVLALAVLVTWWKWDELAKKPGVTEFLARLSRYRVAIARRAKTFHAKALLNKGIALGKHDHRKQAIAIYDDLLKRFGTDSEPQIRVLVARALYNKGGGSKLILGNVIALEAAIAVYDDLLTRFGADTEPQIRVLVAETLLKKGATLTNSLVSRVALEDIAAYDDLLARFGTETEPQIRVLVARALLGKADELWLRFRKEAIAVYDDLLTRFSSDAEPQIRVLVARALLGKGSGLGDENKIAVYDNLLTRFGTDAEPEIRVPVAQALFDKGRTLGTLGRNEEAIAVYDDLLARLAKAPELPPHDLVAELPPRLERELPLNYLVAEVHRLKVDLQKS